MPLGFGNQGFKGWYSRGYLPHFDAPGTWQFITYRLFDSIPSELRDEWEEAMTLQDDRERFRRVELMLDRGLGACSLRAPRVAQMVQDNLWFHDGKTYRLLAWVIMPNHLHVLAEMWKPLGVILRNWKSYTGSQANKVLGTVRHTFWQADYFDRYIRDQEHYRRVVRYIENNPVKAGLVREPAQWRWSSAGYRGLYGSDELPEIPKPRDQEAAQPESNTSPERGQPCPPVRRAHKRLADRAVRAPIRSGMAPGYRRNDGQRGFTDDQAATCSSLIV